MGEVSVISSGGVSVTDLTMAFTSRPTFPDPSLHPPSGCLDFFAQLLSLTTYSSLSVPLPHPKPQLLPSYLPTYVYVSTYAYVSTSGFTFRLPLSLKIIFFIQFM